MHLKSKYFTWHMVKSLWNKGKREERSTINYTQQHNDTKCPLDLTDCFFPWNYPTTRRLLRHTEDRARHWRHGGHVLTISHSRMAHYVIVVSLSLLGAGIDKGVVCACGDSSQGSGLCCGDSSQGSGLCCGDSSLTFPASIYPSLVYINPTVPDQLIVLNRIHHQQGGFPPFSKSPYENQVLQCNQVKA